MIRTLTLVRCDDCPAEAIGCTEDNHSREATAMAAVRDVGFHRVWTEKGLTDLCLDCYAARFYTGRLDNVEKAA